MAIILFDGSCGFCNRSVMFIIKHDKDETFKFASLQSDIGKKLFMHYDIQANVDSIILIEDKLVYSKSTAVLKICKHLHGIYSWLYVFVIIPAPIRNYIYDFVAAHRYRWSRNSCVIPSQEIRKRFLD